MGNTSKNIELNNIDKFRNIQDRLYKQTKTLSILTNILVNVVNEAKKERYKDKSYEEMISLYINKLQDTSIGGEYNNLLNPILISSKISGQSEIEQRANTIKLGEVIHKMIESLLEETKKENKIYKKVINDIGKEIINNLNSK